jgi:uncharacterized protein YuzE
MNDSEVNAAYISFKKRPTEVTTEDIAIALGASEEIVGIEILDASEHFDLKKEKPEIEIENIKVA